MMQLTRSFMMKSSTPLNQLSKNHPEQTLSFSIGGSTTLSESKRGSSTLEYCLPLKTNEIGIVEVSDSCLRIRKARGTDSISSSGDTTSYSFPIGGTLRLVYRPWNDSDHSDKC